MSAEDNKINIFMLTFIVSYKCTNECKHCALLGSPNQDDAVIDLDDVRKYLEDITENYNVMEVGLFGGEPLLYIDLVVSLIEEVKKFGILKIGFPTNGYWGKSESIAKKYALKLKKAGLNSIGFSVDAFHQEFIPLDVVKRAIRAVHEVGIETIYLISQNFGSEEEQNQFFVKTKEIADNFSNEFEYCQFVNSPLQMKGRAVRNLPDQCSMATIPSDKCLNLKAPIFSIDPNGWVFHQMCHGISLGNAKQKSISEIIDNYFCILAVF